MSCNNCTVLARVDVRDLIEWVASINKRTWPSWAGKGPERPSVVNDPGWENLPTRTQRVVSVLLTYFPGCVDTYRSLTTIHPGDFVPYHTDTLCPGWVTRIHVPIVTNSRAFFSVAGKDHNFKVGRAYQVDPSIPHSVRNEGEVTRIHLMFDVVRQ